MSSGAFEVARYQLDDDNIAPIRVQPETLAFTSGGTANAAPTDAVTLNLFVKARKGNREYGIGARNITISWTADPPTDYEDENLQIPILDPAVFDGYGVGDDGTYLGTDCTIVSKKQEQLR